MSSFDSTPNNFKVICFLSTQIKWTGEKEGEKRRLSLVIGNSIAKILNFCWKERGWTFSLENGKVKSRTTEWLSRYLFFLSLRFSYKYSPPILISRSLSRKQDFSLRIAREIPRRRPILIDLLIPHRFNSAPRASLNEDVVNALFPSHFSIFYGKSRTFFFIIVFAAVLVGIPTIPSTREMLWLRLRKVSI